MSNALTWMGVDRVYGSVICILCIRHVVFIYHAKIDIYINNEHRTYLRSIDNDVAHDLLVCEGIVSVLVIASMTIPIVSVLWHGQMGGRGAR